MFSAINFSESSALKKIKDFLEAQKYLSDKRLAEVGQLDELLLEVAKAKLLTVPVKNLIKKKDSIKELLNKEDLTGEALDNTVLSLLLNKAMIMDTNGNFVPCPLPLDSNAVKAALKPKEGDISVFLTLYDYSLKADASQPKKKERAQSVDSHITSPNPLQPVKEKLAMLLTSSVLEGAVQRYAHDMGMKKKVRVATTELQEVMITGLSLFFLEHIEQFLNSATRKGALTVVKQLEKFVQTTYCRQGSDGKKDAVSFDYRIQEGITDKEAPFIRQIRKEWSRLALIQEREQQVLALPPSIAEQENQNDVNNNNNASSALIPARDVSADIFGLNLAKKIRSFLKGEPHDLMSLARSICRGIEGQKEPLKQVSAVVAIADIFHDFRYLKELDGIEKQQVLLRIKHLKETIIEVIDGKKGVLDGLKNDEMAWAYVVLGIVGHSKGRVLEEILKTKYASAAEAIRADNQNGQNHIQFRPLVEENKRHRELKPSGKLHGGILPLAAQNQQQNVRQDVLQLAGFSTEYKIGKDIEVVTNVVCEGQPNASVNDPIDNQASAHAAYHAGKVAALVMHKLIWELAKEKKLNQVALQNMFTPSMNEYIYDLILRHTESKQALAKGHTGSGDFALCLVIKLKDGQTFYITYSLGKNVVVRYNTKSTTLSTLSPAMHFTAKNGGYTTLSVPFGNEGIDGARYRSLPLVNIGEVGEHDIFATFSGQFADLLPITHQVLAHVEYARRENSTTYTQFTEEQMQKGVSLEVFSQDKVDEVVQDWQKQKQNAQEQKEDEQGQKVHTFVDMSYTTNLNADAFRSAVLLSKEAIYSASDLVRVLNTLASEKLKEKPALLQNNNQSTTNAGLIIAFAAGEKAFAEPKAPSRSASQSQY